jgi:DNA ligase-1
MKLSKLYSRSTTGKICTWEIEISQNKYRTISGFEGMKMTTSDWTLCEAKTYCTAEEQAIKEATAIHRKKMETGSFENINDIDNETFFEPMLAQDWHKEKHKVKYPLASQKKLDGVRSIIRKDGMWSRNGKKIISAPHIFEALKPLFEADPDLILDGELFALKESCDFNKIISCVRKIKPTKEDLDESKKYIQYWIYDCPSFKDTFIQRMNFLKTLELPNSCILISTEIANNEEEVMDLYKQYINENFEGQMLRIPNSIYENKRSKGLMKHKTFFDAEYEIKGVEEGKGKLTGKVGRLLFDGFDSAVNGDHEYLEKLFKSRDLIGKMATVKYFELTSDGKPRFPKVICIRDFE